MHKNKTYIAAGLLAFSFFFALGGLLPPGHKVSVLLKDDWSIKKASSGPTKSGFRYQAA